MQGEKAGQTKTRTFNSLRGVRASCILPKSGQYLIKLSIINRLEPNIVQDSRPASTSAIASLLHYFQLPPPVSSQSPYTAAKPPAPQSTHPPADNSPPPRSTSAPPPAPTHSAYAQNRSSLRPSA